MAFLKVIVEDLDEPVLLLALEDFPLLWIGVLEPLRTVSDRTLMLGLSLIEVAFDTGVTREL